ncbi:hypothetical protein L2E82_36528 [Cichorium intybus]|uniref:Uncharacterized protein n=1 Tax=Cichorium intybus TaxID=13427 RepID=A0ACB9BRY1_CICIN|nr:hypothetical protein L2E82_36528 [Cichorium intybus]
MGSCMSSGGDSVTNRSNSALVISPKGDLRQYSTPVFVSDVLQLEAEAAASSFFVCNSDNLSYDEHIRALDSEDELDAGQIYFVLPISKLRDRLSASEMAALAVKASVALNAKANAKTIMRSGSFSRSKSMTNQKRKNKSKISPFVVMETSKINVIVDEEAHNKRLFESNYKQQASSLGVSRSGSIRKIQRYSSRKARLAVRSFRLRLSTIYESESFHHSDRYY